MGKLRSELDNCIAMFRNKLGLTQEQLAQAADVSRQTIVAIEGGTYSPSTVLALRLSLLLDVPVNDLFLLPEAAVATLHERKQQLNNPYNTGSNEAAVDPPIEIRSLDEPLSQLLQQC